MMQLIGSSVFQPPWMQVPYFAQEVQGIIDGVEHRRTDLERRWGVGRLRLLVRQELRTKFDRQVELLGVAIHRGTIEDLRREGLRMHNAWRALDQAAQVEGASELVPEVWEVALGDGRVIALVQTNVEAKHVLREGRRLEVWTLDEVARLIVAFPMLVRAKEIWPGAEVVAVRHRAPELPIGGDAIPDLGGAM